MKKALGLTLGVMTAIGGFVDIGNIVTSGITGARYGMTLAWAVVLGTIAMAVFGEMAGRVAAVAHRPVYHVVRERLGVRASMLNASSSVVLNVLTVAAEIGGTALVLQLATGVPYLLWVPLVAAAAWLVVWRMPFQRMERVLGLLGLSMLVFVVALFWLPTDWAALWDQTIHPAIPAEQAAPTWWFYAISLIGACLVPYQVIFFSSGGREEHWSIKDLREMRLNTFLGFPFGGLLSLALMAVAVPVLRPLGIQVNHVGQAALPVAVAFGGIGLAIALFSFLVATFAAAAESTLSTGYAVAQYFGWSWGKARPPVGAARFQFVCLATVVAAAGTVLTTIDPITITIVSVVLGAAAIPLTYFPVLVVANDRRYLGEHVNGVVTNTLGTVLLVVMVVVALVTVPLLLLTRAGQ